MHIDWYYSHPPPPPPVPLDSTFKLPNLCGNQLFSTHPCFCLYSFCIWGEKFPTAEFWMIARKWKKTAKFLMETFTCRSTFLYCRGPQLENCRKFLSKHIFLACLLELSFPLPAHSPHPPPSHQQWMHGLLVISLWSPGFFLTESLPLPPSFSSMASVVKRTSETEVFYTPAIRT